MGKRRIKKKICPNCGHNLLESDNFCANCGQENHTHKIPVSHYFYEVIEGLTHFDTKFLITIKTLFSRPGLLTKYYNEDIRAKFVPPVRMYIFTAFVFFLVIGLFKTHDDKSHNKKSAVDVNIDLHSKEMNIELNTKETAKKVIDMVDSLKESGEDSIVIGFTDNYAFKDVAQFAKSKDYSDHFLDSVIKSKGYTPNWVKKKAMLMALKILNNDLVGAETEHKIVKSIYYLMFVLLPIFAFFLYLFYRRKAKDLFYTEALVFAYHFHTFAFVTLMILHIISYYTGFDYIFYFFVGIMIYFVWSSKTVFDLPWFTTIRKTIGITIIYLITMAFFFLGAVINSVF